MTRRAVLIAVLATCTAACGSRESGGSIADTAARDSTPAAGGMAGMAGMTMESGRMTDEMRAHLSALDGAGADSLRAALPAHRQRLANMIAQMNREMRDMNMAADAAWDATVDSLRQDLTRMPELSAGEVAAMMPAHHARVERLMASHHAMMGQMRR